MTTNIWLEYILRDIPSFVGVFSSDETILPKVYPSSCIVNFSSKNDVGTHFITLLFDNPNRCRYFDPLDLSFIPDNLSKFLNFYFPNKVYKIHFKIQHDMSNFCGIHCIFICLLYHCNFPILKTLEINFFRDKLSNDEKVTRLLCKLVKRIYLQY